MTRHLSDLLPLIEQYKIAQAGLMLPAEQRITSVTGVSQHVQPGGIFVAVKGENRDGHLYLDEAQKQGAVLCLGEQPPNQRSSVPYVQVSDSRWLLSCLIAKFYHDPSCSLKIIGVTGTSGKTTVTYLLESIFRRAGYSVGVLGTVECRLGSRIFDSHLTTPDPETLQNILFQMKLAGCQVVIMEVSSHALRQKRVAGVAFDGMIFTNLSPEHLDFHRDMEDYYQAKSMLFKEYAIQSQAAGKNPRAVVSQVDPFGQRLLKEIQEANVLQGVGFEQGKCLKIQLEGLSGVFDHLQIRSPLIGKFNALNIAAAIQLARSFQLPDYAIIEGIEQLKSVPGRLEKIINSEGLSIWIDYAHKPDALKNVLQSLREVVGQRKIITVFGCGGDRDRSKRSVMGEIAVKGSDLVWVTSDNPRTEDPQAIIQDILSKIHDNKKVKVEVDRKKAIFAAIRDSKPNDCLLIAGKGHENYQIIGQQKLPWDDREAVRTALGLLRMR